MTNQFKTKPFSHQLSHFNNHKDTHNCALFWEPGCGKTKPLIDTACHLYKEKKIDCLLIVAPNGVHRNWLTDELPKHMPDDIYQQANCFHYHSKKADTLRHKAHAKAALVHPGLTIIAFSYNGFMTKKGKAFAWQILKRRRCFYTLDEAHAIKTPGAKRTRSIVASGKYAPYRRIATGTPVTKGPFDVYSQVRFLDPQFWVKHGIAKTFAEYKQFFGEWFTRQECQLVNGYDPGYDQLIRYKNLDILKNLLKQIGERLTKEDAGLDLPPKLYNKRYFDMSSKQKAIYDQLKDELYVELEQGFIDGRLAIVKLLRLQQIACGYAVTDNPEEPTQKIDKNNPRLEVTLELTEGLPHQAIIWARFIEDINQIMDALGPKAVRYDGSLDDDECEKNKKTFQKGDVQFFVGTPQKGGSGLTFTNAKSTIYYSNSFRLLDRVQSEDRAHRIGQDTSVLYTDIVANDTVDNHIIKSLRDKFDIASQITGDNLREWI